MLKIDLKAARARIQMGFWGEGSVLAETVATHCTGVKTFLEIESEAPADKIAKLARLAEQGCYVIQSLRQPIKVSYEVSLNNQPLNLGAPD